MPLDLKALNIKTTQAAAAAAAYILHFDTSSNIPS
jgi:hypothetical protein